jgi:hypothetical protein
MSFNKILQLDDHFIGSCGLEPTVQIIDFTSKQASVAEDWSSTIMPKPDKTYILVLAMGASEFYGPNRNGDAFRESELKKTYKTFETDAHVYKSHVNKDPLKSYGKVVKAFYNDSMHRVELILEIDNSKAPDIVDKVNSGETVAVSMGCKIKFDVCSICGNEAPTRAQYCTHLRNELNKIYPDGRVVCANNPNPKFFDISIVWRPADKTGYMLKKVASTNATGPSSAWLAEKQAARVAIATYLNKAAEIEKLVSGHGIKAPIPSSGGSINDKPSSLTKQWLLTVVPKLRRSFKEISDEDKLELSEHSLPKVLSSLSDMGIFLATPEFLDLVYVKLTGAKAPMGLASKLVDLQGGIFSMLAKNPSLAEDLIFSGVSPTGAEPSSTQIQDKMAKYIPCRSLDEGWLYSEQRDMFKTSSHPYPTVSLKSNCYENTEITKIAAIAYSGYIASLLDQDYSPTYTKLASLRSEGCNGLRSAKFRPWVVPTVLGLNHTFIDC